MDHLCDSAKKAGIPADWGHLRSCAEDVSTLHLRVKGKDWDSSLTETATAFIVPRVPLPRSPSPRSPSCSSSSSSSSRSQASSPTSARQHAEHELPIERMQGLEAEWWIAPPKSSLLHLLRDPVGLTPICSNREFGPTSSTGQGLSKAGAMMRTWCPRCLRCAFAEVSFKP